MIKIAKKKGFMGKIADLLKDYEDEEIDPDEFDRIEEEDLEDDDNSEPFMIRMTKCYNFMVDAVEFMPPSSSKEYKFKKDQVKARRFYLQLSTLAKDYHGFLNRMKEVS